MFETIYLQYVRSKVIDFLTLIVHKYNCSEKNARVCLFLIVMLKYILHEIIRVKSIRMFGNSKLIYNSENNKLLD